MKSKIYVSKIATWLLLGTTFVLFQDCGNPVSINQVPRPVVQEEHIVTDLNPVPFVPVPTATPIQTVQQKCLSGMRESLVVSVDFPKIAFPLPVGLNLFGTETNPASPLLGPDDNLSEVEREFRGHLEQKKLFQVPVGSTICEMSFSFANQNYFYDDEFILAFDGRVLASSYQFQNLLTHQDGLYLYDWTKIRGTPWINSSQFETPYCARPALLDISSCSFPISQTVGTIDLSFSPSIFQKIISLNPTRFEHEFKLMVTGDNDPSIDGRHDPINFTATVTYVR